MQFNASIQAQKSESGDRLLGTARTVAHTDIEAFAFEVATDIVTVLRSLTREGNAVQADITLSIEPTPDPSHFCEMFTEQGGVMAQQLVAEVAAAAPGTRQKVLDQGIARMGAAGHGEITDTSSEEALHEALAQAGVPMAPVRCQVDEPSEEARV